MYGVVVTFCLNDTHQGNLCQPKIQAKLDRMPLYAARWLLGAAGCGFPRKEALNTWDCAKYKIPLLLIVLPRHTVELNTTITSIRLRKNKAQFSQQNGAQYGTPWPSLMRGGFSRGRLSFECREAPFYTVQY